MASIVIKDLTESIDLDREAMTAITGGARASGRRIFPAHTIPRNNRVFHYPLGVSGSLPAKKSSPSK